MTQQLPEVPLPEPPWRIFATGYSRQRKPRWWSYDEKMKYFVNFQTDEFYPVAFPEYMRVFHHPQNDARAIEIISQAKAEEP
jgi:hypothetical protein